MEAIVATTRTNSRVLRIEDWVGTIKPGKQADIIIVDWDPLQKIDTLQDNTKIKLVMKGALNPRLKGAAGKMG